MNDNKINEDLIINEEDIIYLSLKNEYDLIIIKLKGGKDYIDNIHYLKLDDNLLNKNSIKGYKSNSIYILHYPNSQEASVSYGNGIKFDEEHKYYIQHKCKTLPGSSGGPILNLLTKKVIGIHKGGMKKNGEEKYNIGIFLKDPLEEINDNKINNQINNNNLYNDFNIELKNPIHKLNFHTSCVFCLTIMNDGRLVSGSTDKSIIIYNKETYKPDLIIKEHSDDINCIIQLSSGILASCSSDHSIILFNIKGNKYEILQTLNYHIRPINIIIELKNKIIASCSNDCSIILYIKDNLNYKKDYQISTKGISYDIIQTKDNEICYDIGNSIYFYDLLEKKVKASIPNINTKKMIMIAKDLLVVAGKNEMSIINVINYKPVRNIDVSGAFGIYSVCIIDRNMLLTGDAYGILRQWRIEDDDLILVSKKEKAHEYAITSLVNLGNGHIASGSWDHRIQIW